MVLVFVGGNDQTWTFTHASTLSWMGLKDDYKKEWIVHNSMRSRRWHNQQDKVNTADSAFIFLIIQSQNQ